MTDDTRREAAQVEQEARLDRALDRLLSTAPEPELPGDLAARILGATARIPQEPVPRAAHVQPAHVQPGQARRTGAGSRAGSQTGSRAGPRVGSWFERPRAVAATLAVAAVFGFAAGWIEPLMAPEGQAMDVTAVVFGSEPEIEL